jgi:catechol 2,3-dioxygenase-like lactoylglutathione lyase family enzyme
MTAPTPSAETTNLATATATPLTQGAHHVGLTVPDHKATADFFIGALGFSKVGERPEYPAIFVSDGTVMITIWRAVEPERALPFDRHHNVGLHHLALKVSPDALEQLHRRLTDTAGVDIEFAPEPVGTAGARHMMCAIPGGVRLEFFAPASEMAGR